MTVKIDDKGDGRMATPPGSGERSELEPVPVSAHSGDDPLRIALEEAVYAIRNAARISEWSRHHASHPFDYEGFCRWVEHWCLSHPIVEEIATADDAFVIADAVDQNSAKC